MKARAVLLVAGREVREAMRSRWFLLAGGAFLVLAVGLSALGLATAERSGTATFDRAAASLLNLALLFVPLLTLSVGGLSLAGELEDGALAMLLCQPITRLEVYAGKFIGLLTAVWASVLGGMGAAAVAIGLTAGGDAATYVRLLALLLVFSAATLGIGQLLSALCRSRAKVIGAAFAAWLLLVYISDLGAIGLAIAHQLSPPQLFALSFFNPVQQSRVLGTLLLTDRPEMLGPVGLWASDAFGALGLVAVFSASLVATGLIALAVGYRSFRKAVVP